MNMDNSFIIKLFLNGKDVTEQYSVINAKYTEHVIRSIKQRSPSALILSTTANLKYQTTKYSIRVRSLSFKRVQQIRSTPYLRDALQPIS